VIDLILSVGAIIYESIVAVQEDTISFFEGAKIYKKQFEKSCISHFNFFSDRRDSLRSCRTKSAKICAIYPRDLRETADE